MNKIRYIIFFSLVQYQLYSQPYVDLVNLNLQTFSLPYKENPSTRGTTTIGSLSLFAPKVLRNGNTILFRSANEVIQSSSNLGSNPTMNLYGISLSLGYQCGSKTNRWKSTALIIPKIASDFKESIQNKDWQWGGILLESFQINNRIQLKTGLYYNKEAFGDFFVPLIGVDWNITKRLICYGILPTNYKIEYNAVSNKLYAGLNFKSFTRSFQLSSRSNNDYVRFDEVVLKVFADYYITKNLVFNLEAGHLLGKNPLQYDDRSNTPTNATTLYALQKNGPVFSLSFAYRIRQGLNK